MSLNELASIDRSGSSVGSSRVSSRPPAMAFAACAASPSGRTARLATRAPSPAPAIVVMNPAKSRLSRTLSSVSDASSRGTNSKYAASVTVSGMPTTSTGSPSTLVTIREATASTTTRVCNAGGTSSEVYLAELALQAPR